MPRVLIADDELLLLEGLCQEAEDLGWDVARATHGEEAVRQLRDHADIAAALLDHRMPGWSGLETAAALHVIRPGLPVALVTGDRPADGDLAACGVATVLGKPLDPGSLARFLADVRARLS